MSETKKTKVAWVSGAYYLAKDRLSKIREMAAGSETFDCYEDTSFGDLMGFMMSNSCFSESRLVIVHALPKMTDSEKKKLKAMIESMPNGLLLVFFMIDPSDERAVYNSVEKAGKVFEYPSVVPKHEAKSWINNRAKELGISIEENAAIGIAENSGLDKEKKNVPVDIMESALQRLVMYAPGKKTSYTVDDVILTAVNYDSFVVWDLLNCCDEKNLSKCMNSFSACVSANQNAVSALNEVISIMAWKYRMLFAMKEMIANGSTLEDSIIKTSSIRKIGLEGSGLSAKTKISFIESGQDKGKAVPIWGQRVCMNAVNSFYGKKPTIELYSRKELYLIVKCIEDCLFLARTCKSESEALLISDMIFVTICSSLDTPSLNRMKKSFDKTREQYI